MAGLGISFQVQPSWVDEGSRDEEQPCALATRLAMAKALAARNETDAHLVIGADTVVILDGEILGKPNDPAAAEAMLWRLRGREHCVATGLALWDAKRRRALVQFARTPVRMRPYSHAELKAYVATGDPMDKAGAYAIQHPVFSPVASLESCYANVMGLPLCHLVRGLRRFGKGVPRHPLESCPYALDQGGCRWCSSILDEPAERWLRWLPGDMER